MDASFCVVTSNIRFDNPADGENCWKARREILAKLLTSYRPALIATQEGRRPQLLDLAKLLTPMTLIDTHRSWIAERMYPCLYIDPEQCQVSESGDIWLSATPQVAGSSSFGSAFPRLCTWARVEIAGKKWLVIATHLDHIESSTREAQANVLCNEVQALRQSGESIMLMGDFNDHPGSRTREILLQRLKLNDPWKHSEESSHHPFTGSNPEGARIDWILLSENFSDVEMFYDKSHQEKCWPSDHFPVVCKVTL